MIRLRGCGNRLRGLGRLQLWFNRRIFIGRLIWSTLKIGILVIRSKHVVLLPSFSKVFHDALLSPQIHDTATLSMNGSSRRGFRQKKKRGLQQQRQTMKIVKDFACEAENIGNVRRFRIFPFFMFSCFLVSLVHSFIFCKKKKVFIFSFVLCFLFCFFLFPFLFFLTFCFLFLFVFFFFLEQKPKPEKSSRSSYCKTDDFLL